MTNNVTIIDGRPVGYLTVDEIAEKNGVKPCAVRAMIERKQLHPLTIGYGTRSICWLLEDTVIPKRKPGRPRKED